MHIKQIYSYYCRFFFFLQNDYYSFPFLTFPSFLSPHLSSHLLFQHLSFLPHIDYTYSYCLRGKTRERARQLLDAEISITSSTYTLRRSRSGMSCSPACYTVLPPSIIVIIRFFYCHKLQQP